MSKMIPLKIADMAVESCNKEIARLLFEKAELQGRVIALEAQLESEKAAYKALRASSFTTAVPSEEYEKLKADCEKWRAINIRLLMQQVELGNESISLKAELERLRKAGTEMGKHLPDTDEANRAYIDFEAGGRQS